MFEMRQIAQYVSVTLPGKQASREFSRVRIRQRMCVGVEPSKAEVETTDTSAVVIDDNNLDT